MTIPSKVFTSYIQNPEAVEQMQIARALIESASVVQIISNEEEASKVSEYRHQCNQAARKLDQLRLTVTGGARQVVENINSEFNPKIESLKAEASEAGTKISNYLVEKERKSSAKALEEIEQAKQGVLTAREELNDLTKRPGKEDEVVGVFGSKTKLRDHWTWKITDISKVPEDYLVEPEKRVLRAKLNSEASGRKDNASVPGIEFYNEKTLSSRG